MSAHIFERLTTCAFEESTLQDYLHAQSICIDERNGVIALAHGMTVEFYYFQRDRVPYLAQLSVRSPISALFLIQPGLLLIGTTEGQILYYRYHVRTTIEDLSDAFQAHLIFAHQLNAAHPIQEFLFRSQKRIMILLVEQPLIFVCTVLL